VHWLEGREDLVAEDTDVALALALERGSPWSIGELSVWRRRAGLEVGEAAAAMPYSLELEGDVAGARAAWSELGCPYEAALVVAWGGDPKAGRQSVLALRRLGADAAAKRLGAMLGLRPRRQSRQNPAGLTRRELEVLELLSEGLRNAEIAERLVVTTKTVDHHVSSILAKLDARTRTEAVAAAARLGLEKDR
jgi:DNA-binding CsgD family transcriptional regulator